MEVLRGRRPQQPNATDGAIEDSSGAAPTGEGGNANAEGRNNNARLDGPSQRRKTGPRGGTTTVTESGMVKKNLWVPAEIAEVLRQRAFDERRSEADIIREGIELVLGAER